MKKLIFLISALLVLNPLSYAWYTEEGVDPSDRSIVFEGATADDYETTLSVTDPTADRTITVPDGAGHVALDSSGATVGNVLLETEIDASSELLAIMDDETGTGALVFANTPTLVTPALGAATGTSINLGSTTTISGIRIATDTDLDSGDTSEVVTVTGATSSSKCFGAITNDTTTEVSITSIVPATDQVTVQVSADPSTSGADLAIVCIN